MRRVFIVNPQARAGQALALWRKYQGEIRSVLEGVEYFGAPGDLLSQDFDEWVVVGGDGSVQRAVDALLKSPTKLPALSVLPFGTGSDYTRSLPQDGSWVTVDLGRARWEEGARGFANVASLGFSAQVAAAKERMPRWIPRQLAYLAPTLLELPWASPVGLALRSGGPGGVSWEGRAWAILICKGRYAGGGMHFATEVALDDGAFEVIWVEDMSAGALLARLPQVYQKGLLNQPGVRRLRASSLRIESLEAGSSLEFDLDGEPFHAPWVEFELLAARSTGLRVRVENRWRA